MTIAMVWLGCQIGFHDGHISPSDSRALNHTLIPRAVQPNSATPQGNCHDHPGIELSPAFWIIGTKPLLEVGNIESQIWPAQEMHHRYIHQYISSMNYNNNLGCIWKAANDGVCEYSRYLWGKGYGAGL